MSKDTAYHDLRDAEFAEQRARRAMADVAPDANVWDRQMVSRDLRAAAFDRHAAEDAYARADREDSR